jgi:hypothetical protein
MGSPVFDFLSLAIDVEINMIFTIMPFIPTF